MRNVPVCSISTKNVSDCIVRTELRKDENERNNRKSICPLAL